MLWQDVSWPALLLSVAAAIGACADEGGRDASRCQRTRRMAAGDRGSSGLQLLDEAELENLYAMQRGGYVAAGSYASVELDASVGANWSQTVQSATVPSETYLIMTTRSSADGSSWSTWVAVMDNPGVTASPPDRYFQYRIQPRSETGEFTPTINWGELT